MSELGPMIGPESGDLVRSPETEPQPHELVYFTSTWYPDPKPSDTDAQKAMSAIRQDIALGSLKRARDLGHQIVIVDEGSNDRFKEEVAALGITISDQEVPGMGNGRRQALLEASQRPGARYLVWAEAEKDSFVDSMQSIGNEMADKDADIGMPTRDPALFEETYPDYQVASERRAADLIDDALHQYGVTDPDTNYDWFFGPKVIRNDPKLVELFTRVYQVKPDVQARMKAERERVKDTNERPHARTLVNPEKYSNVLFNPIFEGLLDPDINVVALDPIPFKYPAEQKANETDFANDEARALHVGRRKAQLYGILAELIHFARLKKGEDEKSILERAA